MVGGGSRLGKILSVTLVALGLMLSVTCKGKEIEESEISVSEAELSLTPEIKKAIDEVPSPTSLTVKRLKWNDIKSLNAVPAEHGGSFKAREGDLYIETEKIRAVIQAPSREIGPFTYGGNLIDVDIKREDNTFHDVLGEENLFAFLGHTLKPEKIGLYRKNVVVALGHLDLLDYINPTGMFEMIKSYIPLFRLPFTIDEPKPFKVEKYFVFSNERWIKIIDVLCNKSEKEVTHFFFADIVDSGGSGEFFIPSSPLKGFGYSVPGMPLGLGVFSANFLGFVSEKLDSSYGIFPTTEENLAFIVSGVSILGYGMLENNDPISSLLGIAMGGSKRFLTIGPGGCIYNEKYFIVGNASPSSLTDEFFRIKARKEGKRLFSVSGRVKVRGYDALPVGRARVAIFDQRRNLVTSSISDEFGRFSLLLPEGRYTLIAETRYSQISEGVVLDLTSDMSGIEITLKPPAKVSVEVVEVKGGTEENVPAKISFVCVGECPKKRCLRADVCPVLSTSFRDEVFDQIPDGIQEVVFSGVGKYFDIYITAGKYKVVVSRGMEYSRYEEEVELKEGENRSIKAYIYKVADTPGWLSADTHVHSVNSPDSPVSQIERVITFGAEGVDIIISTDHDWLTDYETAIALAGLQKFLSSLVGQEITTFSYGHFNAYPLKIETTLSNAGAFDWSDKYDFPGKYGIPREKREEYRFLRSLHPREILRGAHLMKPESFRRNIVQLNHPRSGYIEFLKVDTKTLKTSADPCVHRIFPPLGWCGDSTKLGVDDTGLFIPLDVLKDINNIERFDTIEIYNAFSEIPIVINDWFSLLNHGVHTTAVGCSDTHKRVMEVAGIGRTFVWVGEGEDTPQSFRQNIEVQKRFIDSLLYGKAFVSNGVILDKFELCGYIGSSESCIPMGISEMKQIGAPMRLILKVKSADWVDFDEVRIFINTRGTAVKSGHRITKYPKPYFEKRVEPTLKDVTVDGRTYKMRVFEMEIPIVPPTDKDFWLVAVVECSVSRCGGDRNPMFPVVPDKNVRPILITNPIYVDIDGDRRFSPDAPTYAEEK